ncbi:SCP2 sterol-binding domain-containing protein [Frankia sp. CNm7]|uniref:SCP2 sterol-binding domain-containing protein n=1 Tax=Frankia nepalensis TaxID=1836974 RepID=A0A937RTD9_9ACTN|nr:SCP2 sterol-binding domain-containing protein [Frankia nepalensis]MBL7497008.1 SCP2 sterol-binding domain-containing protein [Frankia nepalensis]MBL7510524.1 SCP2 sterol-binding domain-containing protein [Frankia nepalensis]MBL7520979.1 SCP2 sterol-binding domain-containing protein [Frankia nepalensis]MBL7632438.1 SCP2 sterol-binding domain-containing protein [Frankia nepalensis]
MSQTLPDLTAFSLEELVAYTSGLSDDALAALMSGPERSVLLDEYFDRMARQADPSKIKNQDAVVHFHITERPDGGVDHYEMVIRDGACTVSRHVAESARVTVTLDGVRFIKLISGKADPTKMFLTRKLKIGGDMIFGGKVMSWFDIPTA